MAEPASNPAHAAQDEAVEAPQHTTSTETTNGFWAQAKRLLGLN